MRWAGPWQAALAGDASFLGLRRLPPVAGLGQVAGCRFQPDVWFIELWDGSLMLVEMTSAGVHRFIGLNMFIPDRFAHRTCDDVGAH